MSEENDVIKVAKKTNFRQLIEMDVTKYTEKKGQFDYLPWADGHQLMKEFDENSDVTIREFEHWSVISGNSQDFLISKELPYQSTGSSAYVEVTVRVKGKDETEIFPVLDFRNQDVADPTMSQVNKALKRGFVKALAKHGLGLYIYRGEDLPVLPIVGPKELERTEAALQKLNSIVGTDTTEEMIHRLNQWTEQNFKHLVKIEDLKEMTVEHYGLIGRLIAEATNKAETVAKENKKAKKTETKEK